MQAWLNFLAQQEQEIGTETVHKWLKPLRIVKYDACNLYLEAKDSFQVLWFEEHMRKKVQTKFVNNNQKKIKIHLLVQNVPVTQLKKKKEKQASVPASVKFNLNFDYPDSNCTFDNFIQNDSNLLAYKVFTKTAGYKDQPLELGLFNPIFIHSNSGFGKSHLLMAFANELMNRKVKVIYVRAESFTEHVVTAIRAGEMSKFRQSYRNADVLIIDDVHIFSKKGATQEELFHTFNSLQMTGKQIVLSANCAPGDLQFIEPRLISRFEWGIVLSLDNLTAEDVKTILLKKIEILKFPLAPKVIQFLLDSFKSSLKALIRALEALVLRIHLNQADFKYPSISLTVPMVKHHLQDLLLVEEKNTLTSEKIIQQVAEHFGITTDDIKGKAQSRDCVVPRHLAIYFCRKELKIPFTKLGDLFGGRDHSTVMSSHKIVLNAIENNDMAITDHYHLLANKLKKTE